MTLVVFATGFAQAQSLGNADPPTRPFLRLDVGMHTAEITDLAIDRSGALIATASTDKTVRLWHADDGSPIATLRVPIAPGAEGRSTRLHSRPTASTRSPAARPASASVRAPRSISSTLNARR